MTLQALTLAFQTRSAYLLMKLQFWRGKSYCPGGSGSWHGGSRPANDSVNPSCFQNFCSMYVSSTWRETRMRSPSSALARRSSIAARTTTLAKTISLEATHVCYESALMNISKVRDATSRCELSSRVADMCPLSWTVLRCRSQKAIPRRVLKRRNFPSLLKLSQQHQR